MPEIVDDLPAGLVREVTVAELSKRMRDIVQEYMGANETVDGALRRLDSGELRGTVIADELLMLRAFRDG